MRPKEVNAIQLDDKNSKLVLDFMGKDAGFVKSWDTKNLYYRTANAEHLVMQGDYVIRKADGGFEVMTKDNFETLYEKVPT